MIASVVVRSMRCVFLLSLVVLGSCVASSQAEAQLLLIAGTVDVKGRDTFGTQFALGSGLFSLELTVAFPGSTTPDSAGQQTWSSAFFDLSLQAPNAGFPRGGTTNVNSITAAREEQTNAADFLSFFIDDCSAMTCSFPIDAISNATEELGFEGAFGNALLADGTLGAGPFATLGDFAQAADALDLSMATSTFFNASWVPECLLLGEACPPSNGPGDIRFVSVTGTINDIIYPFVPVVGLLGDYNQDSFVNAADYTVYRNRKAGIGGNTLINDAGAAGVTIDDYNYWKAHYGESSGSGSSLLDRTANVPEPAGLSICLFGVVLLAFARKQRRSLF